jgi:hypothetical protein
MANAEWEMRTVQISVERLWLATEAAGNTRGRRTGRHERERMRVAEHPEGARMQNGQAELRDVTRDWWEDLTKCEP